MIAPHYDIHGNLPALEAVLGEVRDAGADEIVVGGDVFPGPMSKQALALLLGCELPERFLRGNRTLLRLGRVSASRLWHLACPEELLSLQQITKKRFRGNVSSQ